MILFYFLGMIVTAILWGTFGVSPGGRYLKDDEVSFGHVMFWVIVTLFWPLGLPMVFGGKFVIWSVNHIRTKLHKTKLERFDT